MIEDKIEIVIPTYNRAKFLNNTLDYLLNSPFKDCKITVRDNASNDKTPVVCNEYSKLFKNFSIIRNNKNIGGNANILRSFEQATFPYVWVLADNDYLNFDRAQDFIDAIESEKYDLIICSSALYKSDTKNFHTVDSEPISEHIKRHTKNTQNYLVNTTQELALILKEHYFIIGGFVSSTIYRTSLIDSDVLIQGSDLISCSYPHFSLIENALDKNLLTYKTKYDVVFWRGNDDEVEVMGLETFARYLDCISIIKNRKFRSYAEIRDQHKLYYKIPALIIYAKANHDPNLKISTIKFIQSMYKLRGWFKGSLYQILIMMAYFVPTIFCEHYVKKRG